MYIVMLYGTQFCPLKPGFIWFKLGLTHWAGQNQFNPGKMPTLTTIGTEVAHITRDSDTTFKVKKSKVNLQEQRHIVPASCTACYKCMKKFFSYSRCYSNTQKTELHLSSSDTLCANSPIVSLACSTNLIVSHLHNVDV